MPMSVILAILFETATDLGDVGIDEVYGHGLVNLEKAITLQGNLSFTVPIDPAMTAGTLVVTATNEFIVPATASTVTNFSDLTVTSTMGEVYLSLPAANAITGNYSELFRGGSQLSLIGADDAHDRGYFGQNVTVAIYGTGLRIQHPYLTANLLSGIRYNADGSIDNAAIASEYDFAGNSDIIGADTFAAGIIGANNPIYHGVAPSVAMLPLQGPNPSAEQYGIFRHAIPEVFEHVATSGIQIMHNGWSHKVGDVTYDSGGRYYGSDLGGSFGAIAILPHLLHDDASQDLIAHFNDINTEIGDADVALVWAAGDLGWNEETGGVYIMTSDTQLVPCYGCSCNRFLRRLFIYR